VSSPRRLRIAFIGIGGVVRYAHLPALKELGYTPSACVGVDEARVRAFAEQVGCRGYTDYREMLSKESPDVVLVATPHRLHAQMTVDAVNSGAHVYVEKPMALTLGEALSVVEAAKKRSRIVAVGHNYRTDFRIQQAARIVYSGRLGKLYHARGFMLRQRGIPSAPTFTTRKLAGGGAVYDLASHVLDTLLLLTMFREPRRVKGFVYSAFSDRAAEFAMGYPQPVQPGLRMDVEDFGSALITFDDGLNMYIEVSWAGYFKENRTEYTVIGTRGGIHIDSNLHYIISIEGEIFASTPTSAPHIDTYREAWRIFLRAVESGDKTALSILTTAEQGAINVAILEKIYESASRGGIEVNVSIPRSIIEEALEPLRKIFRSQL